MRRLKGIVAAAVAVFSVIAMVTPAAAAQATYGMGVFVGSATVTPTAGGGLYLPVSDAAGCGGGGLCPGKPGNWSFASTPALSAGLGATVGLSPSVGIGTVVAGAAGKLSPGAFGLGPWCGYSSGTDGTGTVTIVTLLPNPPLVVNQGPVPISSVRWVQSAATLIVFDGRAGNPPLVGLAGTAGVVVGVVSAVPPIPGVIGVGSCRAGTATQFTIVGAAWLATATLP